MVAEASDGVVVKYVGLSLPPATKPPKRRRCCPLCGWGPATQSSRYASNEEAYFFECSRCADPNARRPGPTRWKEPRGS